MAGARGKTDLVTSLQFEENGKHFICSTDAPGKKAAGRDAYWWWFEVAGDGSRYAPFRASGEDTEDSVRRRVVEYYFERQARRSEPTRPFGGRRPLSVGAPRPAAAPGSTPPSEQS